MRPHIGLADGECRIAQPPSRKTTVRMVARQIPYKEQLGLQFRTVWRRLSATLVSVIPT